MLLVNRTALVVKPKQPYIDWANSLDSSSDGPVLSLEDPELDHNVYLVDEVIDPDELQEQLRRHTAQSSRMNCATGTCWRPTGRRGAILRCSRRGSRWRLTRW